MGNITLPNDQNITPETLKSLGRYDFPNPISIDPDGTGLVAVGGDLAADTLISAY
ncbi:MAG: leucyl/phenylalanyl-tRNA--protein transferase, partial [Psychrobacter sp.]|nr:leucyl/phenylalanyl-tRNA--protein transferase [Psychrobacter sp.]